MKSRNLLYLASLVVVLGLGCGGRSGISVTVKNNTTNELSNIKLLYQGDPKSCSTLAPGKTFTTKIKPTSDSSLDVDYTEHQKKQRRAKVDVYFESNYRGTVDVTIEPNEKVSWKDNIQLPAY